MKVNKNSITIEKNSEYAKLIRDAILDYSLTLKVSRKEKMKRQIDKDHFIDLEDEVYQYNQTVDKMDILMDHLVEKINYDDIPF